MAKEKKQKYEKVYGKKALVLLGPRQKESATYWGKTARFWNGQSKSYRFKWMNSQKRVANLENKLKEFMERTPTANAEAVVIEYEEMLKESTVIIDELLRQINVLKAKVAELTPKVAEEVG